MPAAREARREQMYRAFDVIERWTGDEQQGRWRAEIAYPTDAEVSAENFRAAISIDGRGELRYGEPILLLRRVGAIIMSDSPNEREDHFRAYQYAKLFGGRVLVHGLGLGAVTHALLGLDNVEHVDVVEIAQDVIDIVEPKFAREIEEGRLTIHHDDALTKKWPPGSFWTVVWHDIWDDISDLHLPQMHTLHRKFAARSQWQGSWARERAEWMRDVIADGEKREAEAAAGDR